MGLIFPLLKINVPSAQQVTFGTLQYAQMHAPLSFPYLLPDSLGFKFAVGTHDGFPMFVTVIIRIFRSGCIDCRGVLINCNAV